MNILCIATSETGGAGVAMRRLADGLRSRPFDRRRQRHARRALHGSDQRLSHPARGPDDDKPHVPHGCGPSYPATITVSVWPASLRYLTAA